MAWFAAFIGRFRSPSMAALLDREHVLLDRIFGEHAYEIISSRRQQATIRSSLIDVSFGCERDGEIGSLIELREPPAEGTGTAGTWLWGEFLGVDARPLERDGLGRVVLPPGQQLERELAIVARLMAEVFSDPDKMRQAIQFVEDQTRKYNEGQYG